MRNPCHELLTVAAAGPPYTEIRTGYFLLLSRSAGRTQTAGSDKPSLVGMENRATRPSSYSESCGLFASANVRTGLPPVAVNSILAGWATLDQVSIKKRLSGERRMEWVPGLWVNCCTGLAFRPTRYSWVSVEAGRPAEK
ncbi:MAG: hypothetical protein BWY83_03237 [bacterium ADurb.Bin478]|nr:MAG: hypothetical protein BWY83_03237 [bacterium ADurb.Bin478]